MVMGFFTRANAESRQETGLKAGQKPSHGIYRFAEERKDIVLEDLL